MDCHSNFQAISQTNSHVSEYVIPHDAYQELSATRDQLGALEHFVSDPHLKDFLASFHKTVESVLGQVSERPAPGASMSDQN